MVALVQGGGNTCWLRCTIRMVVMLLMPPVLGCRHLMGSLHIEVVFVGCLRQHVPKESQAEVSGR